MSERLDGSKTAPEFHGGIVFFSVFQIHSVQLRGFEHFNTETVKLGNEEKLQVLVPEIQKLKDFIPREALVISENNEPILGFILGDEIDYRKQLRHKQLSLINLSNTPENVIVDSKYRQQLENNDVPNWPGYQYYNHIRELKCGFETLVVQKTPEDQFIIFFKNKKGEKVTPDDSIFSEVERLSGQKIVL